MSTPVRLRIRIDATSPIPPFEQLRAQIALQVSSGRLGPGTRLPTVRSLATELELSNGTVARAYRELEYAGILIGRGRKGTFVTETPPNAYSPQERKRVLREAARHLATVARQLDADEDETFDALTEAWMWLERDEAP